MKNRLNILLISVLIASGMTGVCATSRVQTEEYYNKACEVAKRYEYHEGDIERSMALYPDREPMTGIEYTENGMAYELPGVYFDSNATLISDYHYTQQPAKIVLNEAQKETDTVIYNDRVLVPGRLFTKLGCNVAYDPEYYLFEIYDDNTVLELMPHLLAMRKGKENGIWVSLNTVARMVNGEVYVPVRDVAYEFGINVEWDAKSGTVILQTSD